MNDGVGVAIISIVGICLSISFYMFGEKDLERQIKDNCESFGKIKVESTVYYCSKVEVNEE